MTETLPTPSDWLNRYVSARPREECGVFGVFGHPEAGVLTTLGLHALQHRGQEACGLVSHEWTTDRFHYERHAGLVGERFLNRTDLDSAFPGRSAIGHVRYSTAGGSDPRNAQPLYADLDLGGFAIAHNGNLTNFRALHSHLHSEGAIFQSFADTEVILHLIARSKRARMINKFIDALSQLEGAYALVALTQGKMIGARDPLGIRPLVLGFLDKDKTVPVLASETCALDMIGASFEREIEPGEIVVCTEAGIESLKPFPEQMPRPCLFEYVYFARPDSRMGGKSVYEVRRRMGRRLAEETGVANADVIVPVPDSGIPASIGFSEYSGVPYALGIVRNHYIGRTFIAPTQSVRDLSVRRKHSPNRAVLEGKTVVLIDDSIVRGTTSGNIVRMVREAGAREVHLRSACPPILFPDFYGIDMPSRKELMAANHDLDSMCKAIGADSLGFLSIDGLYWAMGEETREAGGVRFADHYFTGDYPTPRTDFARSRNKDEQLTLLGGEAA